MHIFLGRRLSRQVSGVVDVRRYLHSECHSEMKNNNIPKYAYIRFSELFYF